MDKTNFIHSLISSIYRLYITFVVKTTSFSFHGDYNQELLTNSIIGFWHQDSFGVNFLLKLHPVQCPLMNIIITADRRGDYIEDVIKPFGTHALRMPDGPQFRHFLTTLKDKASIERTSICIALDGPLGPFHIPKKIGPMLAHHSNKHFIVTEVSYTRMFKLFKRWDKYIIPLPFGKISFNFYDKGLVDKDHLRNYNEYQKIITNHKENQ